MLDRVKDTLAPRWLIFLMDVFIVLSSLALAYLLRFDFDIPSVELELLHRSIFLFLAIRILGFVATKTYAGIIRYTSTEDAVRILKMMIWTSGLLFLSGLLRYAAFDEVYFLPRSIILLEFFLSSFFLISYRLFFKVWYLERNRIAPEQRSRVIIYGAGEAGLITKRTLARDGKAQTEVIAFLDDDTHRQGKKIEGIPIIGRARLAEWADSKRFDQLVIAIMSPDKKNRQAVIDLCLDAGVKVLHVPPVHRWIEGELSYRQLRNIEVTELLEREEISLDLKAIESSIRAKTVMITGAAGSIGAELVRQILPFEPAKLILIDQAESPLHEIALEAEERSTVTTLTYLADICDERMMARILQEQEVDTLYHAAAYKHVPMLERHVEMAIRNNLKGTKNLADLAVKYGISRFVFISTDKAVNPTNVMGATKRAAEMYVQSLSENCQCRFVTTRFGNVLGSNGSVIPRFRAQIEAGGPVTVTHREIERYFMTIPEASRLVLEAAAMGEGGEIFVFDMGQPVLIMDLAEKMIRLSGLKPEEDIRIEVTGLRPGEKIKEEVLSALEHNLATHNPRILKARGQSRPHSEVQTEVNLIIAEAANDMAAIRALKSCVPEYRSNNSPYEVLDT